MMALERKTYGFVSLVLLSMCFCLHVISFTVPSCWPWQCEQSNETSLSQNSTSSQRFKVAAGNMMALGVVFSLVALPAAVLLMCSQHSAMRQMCLSISVGTSMTSCVFMLAGACFLLVACPTAYTLAPMRHGVFVLCLTSTFVIVALVFQCIVIDNHRHGTREELAPLVVGKWESL